MLITASIEAMSQVIIIFFPGPSDVFGDISLSSFIQIDETWFVIIRDMLSAATDEFGLLYCPGSGICLHKLSTVKSLI